MLEKVVLNQKTIPIPVPISTLGKALEWIEGTLSNGAQCITRITLDEIQVDLDRMDVEKKLNKSSKLVVQLDSIESLAIQSLEAIQNLLYILEREQRPLAVSVWDLHENAITPKNLTQYMADLDMICGLCEHVNSFIDHNALKNLSANLNQYFLESEVYVKKREWRGFVDVLIKKLAPILDDLSNEVVGVQSELLSK